MLAWLKVTLPRVYRPFPLCGSGSGYQDCTASLEYKMNFTCAYRIATQLFYSFLQYYKCDPQDFNGKYALDRVPLHVYIIETILIPCTLFTMQYISLIPKPESLHSLVPSTRKDVALG